MIRPCFTSPTIRTPILAALWCLSLSGAFCGERLRFETLGLNQGLSQTYVFDILQDRHGFMWFATQDGLNRYDGYEFKVYNQEPFTPDSLSDNQVSELFESSRGVLWITTSDRVLHRFERKTERFVRYYPDPEDPTTPNAPVLRALFEDRNGFIWMPLENGGLDRYDPVTGVFSFYPKEQEDGDWVFANVLRQDAAGRLWLGTDGAGLWRFLPEKNRFMRVKGKGKAPKRIPGLRQNNPFHTNIYSDSDGKLWMGAVNNSLTRYDPETNTFERFAPPRGSSALRMVISITPDPSGQIWVIFGNSMVGRVEPDTGRYHLYSHDPENPDSLCPPGITGFHFDKTGKLWVSSNTGGLSRYNRERDVFERIVSNPQDPFGLPGNMITRMTSDRSGNLWFSVQNIGLAMFSHQNQKFARYPRYADDLIDKRSRAVWSFAEGEDRKIWVGIDNGLLLMDPKGWEVLARFPYTGNKQTGPAGAQIRFIQPMPDGSIITGCQNPPGISRLDPKTGKWTHVSKVNALGHWLSEIDGLLYLGTLTGLTRLEADGSQTQLVQRKELLGTHAMLQQADGVFWMSTRFGLRRWDPGDDSRKAFLHDPDDKSSISSDNALGLCLDRNGNLWIGTFGGGLNVFRPATESFDHYTRKDGLPNNVVYGILEDFRGNLWLSTNQGLSQFNPETGSFLNYQVGDGLQSPEFNAGAYRALSDGAFLFGGINGFNIFHPADILESPFDPPLTLSATKNADVELGRELAADTELALQPGDYAVAFHFAALDFTNPEKTSYAWMLEGLDPGWVMGGSRRTATYTNLSPGAYRFRVKAADSAGTWSQSQASVNLLIRPTLLQTIWFQIVLFLLIIGSIVLVFLVQRNRLQRQKEEALRARELMRKAEELDYARQVQLSMLPRKKICPPGVDLEGRMITASEVGGDYFDFFEIGPDKLCIAYGDATGHGVAAGLVVGMVKMATTVWSFEPGNLTRLMVNLNAALKKTLPIRSMGMALGLAVLDLETLELEICSSGMPFPLLYRSDNAATRALTLKSPPLGFLEKINTATRRVTLKPGDCLAFLSDGFGERFNSRNRLWGDAAVLSTLDGLFQADGTAEDIIDGLVVACNRHAEGRPNDDDMTVVVLRLTQEAGDRKIRHVARKPIGEQLI
ncbi:MAG: two-component regulator propeller domain-containing protein [Acidobacteriota bacterium]|nr:two-component regulator propeller domain-containing protein [Acidobacteriota bacterium]